LPSSCSSLEGSFSISAVLGIDIGSFRNLFFDKLQITSFCRFMKDILSAPNHQQGDEHSGK